MELPGSAYLYNLSILHHLCRSFAGTWISVPILIVNKVVPSVQGVGLYAGAVTLYLAAAIWSLVRRIASPGNHTEEIGTSGADEAPDRSSGHEFIAVDQRRCSDLLCGDTAS